MERARFAACGEPRHSEIRDDDMRIDQEQLEHLILSPGATFAERSRGRVREEPECEIRTCFQRDIDRITHSKSFRRLIHKTQVFLQPEGDHYRTRLTHTLEVSRIGRTIARGLRLNEDLTEAIALGHDLGHTPFGHAGERALGGIMAGTGFRHNEQSLRVVDVLEKDGAGLNLTFEVRDGILRHTGKEPPETPEGRVIRVADRIAYLNHDVDDAVRAGILSENDIPASVERAFGRGHSKRINALILDVIKNSEKSGEIGLGSEAAPAFNELYEFMFERVYRDARAKREETKVLGIMRGLFGYYTENPGKLPGDYGRIAETDGLERAVGDYVSGMTDKYAIHTYRDLFIPEGWKEW